MTSPAIFGTRQRPRELGYGRDSNRDTLRASVFDVALELGIGSSRAVENLIFDSVLEEDEVSVVLVLPASRQYALAFTVALELSCSSILNGSCHINDTPVIQSVIMRSSLCVRLSEWSSPFPLILLL
jgi:hypothetical protein